MSPLLQTVGPLIVSRSAPANLPPDCVNAVSVASAPVLKLTTPDEMVIDGPTVPEAPALKFTVPAETVTRPVPLTDEPALSCVVMLALRPSVAPAEMSNDPVWVPAAGVSVPDCTCTAPVLVKRGQLIELVPVPPDLRKVPVLEKVQVPLAQRKSASLVRSHTPALSTTTAPLTPSQVRFALIVAVVADGTSR